MIALKYIYFHPFTSPCLPYASHSPAFSLPLVAEILGLCSLNAHQWKSPLFSVFHFLAPWHLAEVNWQILANEMSVEVIGVGSELSPWKVRCTCTTFLFLSQKNHGEALSEDGGATQREWLLDKWEGCRGQLSRRIAESKEDPQDKQGRSKFLLQKNTEMLGLLVAKIEFILASLSWVLICPLYCLSSDTDSCWLFHVFCVRGKPILSFKWYGNKRTQSREPFSSRKVIFSYFFKMKYLLHSKH